MGNDSPGGPSVWNGVGEWALGAGDQKQNFDKGLRKGSHSDHVLARYALYNGNLLTDRVFNLDQYIDKDLPNELPRATAERHVTNYEAADYV